jgi:hypothetical protein
MLNLTYRSVTVVVAALQTFFDPDTMTLTLTPPPVSKASILRWLQWYVSAMQGCERGVFSMHIFVSVQRSISEQSCSLEVPTIAA